MKIGIRFSAFDLFHAERGKMLEEVKRRNTYLIVGLQTERTIDRLEKNKPIQNVVERYIQLKGCNFVDKIVSYANEQDLEDILRAFHIDVRLVGDGYKDKKFTDSSYYEEKSTELYFNTRDYLFSSSDLRRQVAGFESQKTVNVE